MTSTASGKAGVPGAGRPAADRGTRPGSVRAMRCPERDPGFSTSRRRNRPAPGPRRGRRVAINGRRTHAHSHRRPGELLRHRDPLRGPRRRPAGGADPRVPAQRPSLGQAGPGPAGGRPPGHHLRPARVRPVQPAGHRLRLRHLRRRPGTPAGAPGPARRRAGRSLDGHRRGDPLPGRLRLGPGGQGRAGLADPAVPAADQRQPRRGAARACSTGSSRPPGPTRRRG